MSAERARYYAPDLGEELERDPALAVRWLESIPDIEAHPRKAAPAPFDLAKFHGIVHCWINGEWRDQEAGRK